MAYDLPAFSLGQHNFDKEEGDDMKCDLASSLLLEIIVQIC